jgi:hypothetical protein
MKKVFLNGENLHLKIAIVYRFTASDALQTPLRLKIEMFIEVCWDREVAAIAADLLDRMTPIEAVENVCASPLVDVH